MKQETENFSGITNQEALNRLETFGHNELKSDHRPSILRIIIRAVREPMVLLLIGIGLVYAILGEVHEVYSLLTFLILILFITIYQENKTEKTLFALKQLSSPRAVVIREGKQIRIAGNEVVPDDIVIINEGDRIPADIILLKGNPLSIDESILTGESFAIEKSSLRNDVIFSGTLVLKGQALGRVIKTGQNTELGKIGKSLEGIDDKGTPLQKEIRRIVTKLSIIVGFLTLFLILYYWYTRSELLEGILIGLTLAMAILPNELPAVLLIFLAAGAWRISKRNVLTRRVPAIEALGGITHLCVDKTGTLTQNKMIIKRLWNGESFLELNQSLKELPESFHEIMEFGILATPLTPFDPMEQAIKQTGIDLLNKTEHLHPTWKLLKEYQISDELLAVSYAWKGEEGDGFTVGAKGAVEAITDLCHLSQDKTKVIEESMFQMASSGLRVIGVAQAISNSLPTNQHDLDFNFLGLIGFEDPIRNDVPEATRECREAGIRILMMTGDHPETAKNIAQQINLENTNRALTGTDIQNLGDLELLKELETVQIFCRMKPADKLRIVSLLQSSGKVVAMTGDGVNDAPALRKAQIGIAMGKRGTDVAREAASVVLLDDSFSSIVAAIKTGRRIFRNLQKAFSYLLSIHIPITVLSVVPVIFNLPLVLLPIHIAFLHLIIEPASTTLFEAIPAGPDIMRGKQEERVRFISKLDIFRSIISGVAISISVVGVYYFTLHRGLTASDARGITFTTLIITNIILIFIMNRNKINEENKKLFKILTIASIGLMAIVLYFPFFRELFRFESLHFHDLLLCLIVTVPAAVIMYLLYDSKSLKIKISKK